MTRRSDASLDLESDLLEEQAAAEFFAAPEMVFMMGLPAAGKSTVAASMFPTHRHLDPDAIKATLPNYNPARAFEVHEESMSIFELMFNAVIADGIGRHVIDGTGTNAETMVRRINLAIAAGFRTRLVYVTCSLETSLARAAARERNVPEYVIREKALSVQTSFEIVSLYVHAVTVVDNN
jgi:predicted kinase